MFNFDSVSESSDVFHELKFFLNAVATTIKEENNVKKN